MTNNRIKKAADILVNYSTHVKKGEYVQIVFDQEAFPLAKEVYKLVLLNKAFPVMKGHFSGLSKFFFDHANDWQLTRSPKEAMFEMRNTDAIIFLSATQNTRELTNVDPKKFSLRQKAHKKLSDEHLKKRWVIFDYPTNALAQDAEMSLEEFEDFVFNSTNIDWAKTKKRLENLARIVNRVNVVRILHKDTDLTFSIKGRKCIASFGTHNMPDGEVFTAPLENSTTGHIRYTFPAIYGGREVSGICLEFKNGKVINANASKNENFLNQMLNTDSGANVLGEFGIGMNYRLRRFVKQILFDEKIGGTVHLALGNAYPECKGENKSALHWDMIKDLRDCGKLYFDGKLVQKNGKWQIKF